MISKGIPFPDIVLCTTYLKFYMPPFSSLTWTKDKTPKKSFLFKPSTYTDWHDMIERYKQKNTPKPYRGRTHSRVVLPVVFPGASEHFFLLIVSVHS